MSLFLSPQSWPFLFALILLVAIAVIEGLTLLLGFSLSGWFDEFFSGVPAGDASEHVLEAWLGWLHIGKVPVLVVVTLLLTAFAMIGFFVNGAAHSILGEYLPVFFSAPLAFLGALPVVRASATVIARLVPRDETSAEPLENLIGKIGIVVNGTARMNYPAQARVKNDHGQTLYVHVEPDDENQKFVIGESVLLVRQISGARFQAIANPHPNLL